jgi:hypothetical protein
MADYPSGVYSPRTKTNKPGVVYTPSKSTFGYAEDVVFLDDEVVAIENELGIDPKNTSANVAERLKGIRSLAGADNDILQIDGPAVNIFGQLFIDNDLLVDGDIFHGLDNQYNYFGADDDVGITFDGDNMVFDSQLVGSGHFVFKNGNIGIGVDPGVDFTLRQAKSGMSVFNQMEVYSSNVSDAGRIRWRKSHSDILETPVRTVSGDNIGFFTFQGVDSGNNFEEGAFINVFQVGASGSRVPCDMSFATASANAINSNQFVLRHDGNIGMGISNPSGHLHIRNVSVSGTSFILENIDTGGKKYTFVSSGSSNPNGAGDLFIFDSTAGKIRLCINGATGHIDLPNDDQQINFGVDQDVGIYFNGLDMIFDSQLVGSGDFIFQNGKLITDSGRVVKTTRLTSGDSPYTILDSDHVIYADTDGGAITINLPDGEDGRNLRIINTGTSGNDVTVAPNGAELLTGDNDSRTLSDKSVIILTYETTEGWW